MIAVAQPHRFTRLQSLFESFCECFDDADEVVVADVYPAGEAPIEGVGRDSLVAALRERGRSRVAALPGPEALPGLILEIARPGDLAVCLGAGSITQWANELPGAMRALGCPARRAGGVR